MYELVDSDDEDEDDDEDDESDVLAGGATLELTEPLVVAVVVVVVVLDVPGGVVILLALTLVFMGAELVLALTARLANALLSRLGADDTSPFDVTSLTTKPAAFMRLVGFE